jgi:uncharacterized protein (TIGR02117 family)
MISRLKFISTRITISLLLLFCIYILCAFSLPSISANYQNVSKTDSVSVFVISNGVHTDIAIPSKTNFKNWETTFCKDTFNISDSLHNFIAFGWGDKGFYLNTPDWSDLKFSTAFNAAFGLGGTAMHVRYLQQPKKVSEKVVHLNISSQQYKKLVNYIEKSFCLTEGCVTKINHPGYGNNDRFYEANGKYNLFTTCNCWTNKALKYTGVKTGLWTPFASGLMRSIR